jgi:acyl-CoA synthetase (AMP-forming)/AMP-acid ligase II
MDACFVGDEQARPQPGGFDGGWITVSVSGPFKGVPGSADWCAGTDPAGCRAMSQSRTGTILCYLPGRDSRAPLSMSASAARNCPLSSDFDNPRPVVHLNDATSHETLRAVAAEYGDREAYVDAHGERMTFAEWDSAADGTAAALADLGVAEGDVVALIIASSIDYAICYQAAMRLGAITSGVNPRLGPGEVASILRRSRPSVLITEGDRELPPGEFHRLDRSILGSFRSLGRPAREATPDPGRPVAIVWTSGTTGDPKGAVFDHRNLTAVSAGAGPLRAAYDRRISPSPFSHVGYMVHLTEEIEYVMTTIVPPTPWKADAVLALMERERATVGQGVPTQWRLLLDRPEFDATDLSTLRICGTGAAPASPALVREMQERMGCPVVIGYTSTEAALTTGSLPGDDAELIARTVGRARANVELRLVDDDGAEVAPRTTGGVQCRSGAVMRRYWEDPDATSAVLDEDGWLDTGDGGWLDEAGYLTLVGRRTEMYFRGGYNVYPVEVERVVSEHPAVAQVAIVAKLDPVLGDIGVAFVIAAENHDAPTLAEIREWSNRSISNYKAPDMLEIVSELPLTSMGKVDKRALVERARGLPRIS